MQKIVALKLKPHEVQDASIIHQHISEQLLVPLQQITGYYFIKQSIDARSRQQIWINMTLLAFINEPFYNRPLSKRIYKDVSKSNKVTVIIGAGPAGLFAALKLIELGIKPVVLERGKNVRDRRRDLAMLNKEGLINEDSNYCFGEGGAGTYSDGKLYTRSNKRGSIDTILNTFVQFGASENILYQSHPHIGTNKLPSIIAAMRLQIIESGGEVHFNEKVVDFNIKHNNIESVITASNKIFTANNFILATGHSARDIFHLLHKKNILIESKPFALGVRIEHPQEIIDACQYHINPIKAQTEGRSEFLPPASYSLVEQVDGKGVFSFCMCPGGIIACASTSSNELVVNGWSPSKRNNPFANSGMVVSVDINDAIQELNKLKTTHHINDSINNPLSLLQFQEIVEQKAFAVGGGKFVAPAQRVVDFCNNKASNSLPNCSYIPGAKSSKMSDVLPSFIYNRLQNGIKAFGKRMKGYYTNEAVVVATESRTSSPIRIPRNIDTLQHIQIKNLYPCGEGAGYAGGIVSAAMDGEKVANAIFNHK